jgi:acylphosphatase
VSALSRVRLRINGRVQGVFFRYDARQQAQLLHLSGWVRNCSDGSVEALVEGTEEAVQHFVRWAQRGPSQARVDRVEVQPEHPEGTLQDFRVIG